ncbi:MAG: hypothetical protein ACXV3D_09095 [Halobacteriota archaeon]
MRLGVGIFSALAVACLSPPGSDPGAPLSYLNKKSKMRGKEPTEVCPHTFSRLIFVVMIMVVIVIMPMVIVMIMVMIVIVATAVMPAEIDEDCRFTIAMAVSPM